MHGEHKPVHRVRIEAPPDPTAHAAVAQAGSIAHISQQRFYYVDVEADGLGLAVDAARAAVKHDPRIDLDGIRATTPGAPLDQRNSLDV